MYLYTINNDYTRYSICSIQFLNIVISTCFCYICQYSFTWHDIAMYLGQCFLEKLAELGKLLIYIFLKLCNVNYWYVLTKTVLLQKPTNFLRIYNHHIHVRHVISLWGHGTSILKCPWCRRVSVEYYSAYYTRATQNYKQHYTKPQTVLHWTTLYR